MRTIRFAAVISLATVCLFGSGAAVSGEVISTHQGSGAFSWAVMNPDGSNFRYISCGGLLSYGSVRFYFWSVPNGNTVPTQQNPVYLTSEIYATTEDCSETVTLTHLGNFWFGSPGMSPDGTMIAVPAVEWDLTHGVIIQSGLYLADVVYWNGKPANVINVRLIVPTSSPVGFDWSRDSTRIVYGNTGAGGMGDLFVYSISSGTSVNITNTPTQSEDAPAFSPNEVIAYSRISETNPRSTRYDIFTIPANGGAEKAVTSKAGGTGPRSTMPCFSPDGRYISLVSGEYGSRSIYTIRADGSGKATKVAGGSKNVDFSYAVWR